jgi:hypothetical protein
MKVQKLNDRLVAGKSTSVLFPYPPVALPIDKAGKLVSEDAATDTHYSTFVYELEKEAFYIFEFKQDVVDGLLAYRARHGTISNIEILLSRESDGELRMTTGNTEVKPGIISKTRYDEFLTYHDKLFDRYMSKLGVILHEYT